MVLYLLLLFVGVGVYMCLIPNAMVQYPAGYWYTMAAIWTLTACLLVFLVMLWKWVTAFYESMTALGGVCHRKTSLVHTQ